MRLRQQLLLDLAQFEQDSSDVVAGVLLPAARNDTVLELLDVATVPQLAAWATLVERPAAAAHCTADGPGLLAAKRTPPLVGISPSVGASPPVGVSPSVGAEDVIVANHFVITCRDATGVAASVGGELFHVTAHLVPPPFPAPEATTTGLPPVEVPTTVMVPAVAVPSSRSLLATLFSTLTGAGGADEDQAGAKIKATPTKVTPMTAPSTPVSAAVAAMGGVAGARTRSQVAAAAQVGAESDAAATPTTDLIPIPSSCIVVTDRGDGTYAVTYHIPSAADVMGRGWSVLVHVALYGEPLPGSPFLVPLVTPAVHGQFLGHISGLKNPYGLAFDTADAARLVFVSDSTNNRVCVFARRRVPQPAPVSATTAGAASVGAGGAAVDLSDAEATAAATLGRPSFTLELVHCFGSLGSRANGELHWYVQT
jgi:hypothetical protein